jgi:hypothetical protein
MLPLVLLRLFAPRAFQLVNLLGLTFIFVSLIAIVSGMIDHDRQQPTQHFERVKGTR